MKSLPLVVLLSEKVATTTPSQTVSSGALDNTNCDGQCNDPLSTCSVSTEDPGYVCNCPLGYEWANDACEDIDECAAGNTSCTGAYMCVNLIGSMTCGCADGYELDLETNECVDKNECADGSSGCDQGCTNLVGSFECGCNDGYTVADDGTCVDIDECTDGTATCADGDTCVNTAGGWGCSCATSGYVWNAENAACQDDDECAAGVCSAASNCVNTDGSYTCSCPDGYMDKNGDGHVCEWTKFPEYYTWLPAKDSSSMYFFSAASSGTGAYSSMKKAQNALADMVGFRGLLCEEFFDMPAHTLRPDHYYICDDEDQTLSHARYSNKNQQNCVFNNYQVTCEHNPWQYPHGANVMVDFIAVSSGNGCHWDNENGNKYAWDSNQGHGQFYDTALCQMTVGSQLEAAQVCAAYGGSLFQEEVDLHMFAEYMDEADGCGAKVEDYAKARGRLYQLAKIGNAVGVDASNLQVLTGYRANDDADNWCWLATVKAGWEFEVCLDTLPMDQAPVGTFIDATLPWQSVADGLQCEVDAVASSLNAALQTGMDNIKTVVADRALLWDIAQEAYVQAPQDQTFENFACERYAWDCSDANTCPSAGSTCNPAGYCECPEGFFLNGNKECVEEADKIMIECHDDHMIAYFAIDSINRVDPSQPLHLNDGCADQIDMVDGYYRVRTDLDKCGTTASYETDANMEQVIVFSNYMTNDATATSRSGININIATKVNSKFECHYRMVTTVSDVNGYASDLDEECEDDGTGLCGGNPGGIGVNAATATLEKEDLGTFSYELRVFSSDGFNTDLTGAARVGETLHFGIVPSKQLNNVVHRATRCTVSDFEDKEEYVLFDAAVNAPNGMVDPFVHTTRYTPLYTDTTGTQTCGVTDVDKFSYTVFEFIDQSTGSPVSDGKQHIKCTVEVCIKEDDMSTGPCAASTCDAMWGGNVAPATVGSRFY